METRECLKPLLERRSVRVYQDREIPLETILEILRVARWAPSARNRQPWELVVVRDRSTLQRLSRIHIGARPLEMAKAAVVVLCDRDKAPVTYQVDCANIAMYIMLAAHCMGVGTVWINSLRNVDEVREIVGAPENMVPVAIISMGYPAEAPEAKPRRPLEDIVHLERFGNRLKQP